MNLTYENPAYDIRNPFISLDPNDDYDTDSEMDEINGRGGRGGRGAREPTRFGADIELNPNREMAIDCPADFLASVKDSPRRPVPPGQVHVNMEGQKTDAHLEERIKNYQKDLKKRRELEEKQLSEEEFLRTSLRGSKKLQALEKKRKIEPIGVENVGFQDDLSISDDIGQIDLDMTDLPQRTMEEPCGVERLIVCFNNVKSIIPDNNDKHCLNNFFQNPKLQMAVAIHEKVVATTDPERGIVPVCHDVRNRCQDLYQSLPVNGDMYVSELKSLLCKARLQSLLLAHDRVACQYSTRCQEDELIIENDVTESPRQPSMTSPRYNTDYDDVNGHVTEMAIDVPVGFENQSRFNDTEVKIVRLIKSTEPIGATVKNEGDSVLIARIVSGGLAEKCGLLNEGDEILEVNGQDIRGMNVNDVSDMLSSMSGQITFCTIPASMVNSKKPKPGGPVMVHIRALFNYDPEDDIYLPCRELGLNFAKCDVLHVINQDDANWWQAYREGEEVDNQLAGLIPSKTFQEHREAMKQVFAQTEENDNSGKKSCCKKKKKKKMVFYNEQNDTFDAESIPTYEEVSLYYPQPNRKRPIVLIGPPNVGRQELRQRLMESDVNRFAGAVPHTSRPRKDTEKDGQDYHFIPRQVFEADILQNKFIEHGEYEHNLYGTSIAAVQVIIDAGKVCLLNVHPQSLKLLKSSNLKPYIFFVAPPNLEKLRMNCHRQGLKLSEDGLKEILAKGREIEENFGHYFDYCVVNYEMDRTYEEILTEINRLDLEPQWVPTHWLYS